jgi:polar amino acid transport system permease protein
MTYIFQFGAVFASFDDLLAGALHTIELTFVAVACGLLIAMACSYLRLYGPRWARVIVLFYIELIRNTPLLVQLFFVFFALPLAGIKLSPNQAALLTMATNLGAYASEILRAGVEAVPRAQIEAGAALGLRPAQIFRFVIFRPALKIVFPALASQFVLLLLGSAVVSAVAADDLTSVANVLQSRTFRAFEVYAVVLVMYLVMAIGFRLAFGGLYRAMFERRGSWS